MVETGSEITPPSVLCFCMYLSQLSCSMWVRRSNFQHRRSNAQYLYFLIRHHMISVKTFGTGMGRLDAESSWQIDSRMLNSMLDSRHMLFFCVPSEFTGPEKGLTKSPKLHLGVPKVLSVSGDRPIQVNLPSLF